MKNYLKQKKGSMLTEALISIFIIGTLFISIGVAVTSSITNTKLLQETNNTSTYAQKIIDGLYAISDSESDLFFEKIQITYSEYLNSDCYKDENGGAPLSECPIDLFALANEFRQEKSNGNAAYTNEIGLYDVLNYNDEDPNFTSAEKEASQYNVDLSIIPSETAETYCGSANFFTTYNAHLTDGINGGRIFNLSEFENILTFKLVVSKNENTLGTGTADYTTATSASVTYIFQIKV